MLLNFIKMNGAGNDFILFDNRARQIKLRPEQVIRLCDRHRGVGADGVIALIPSDSRRADWAWEFYNSDGSHAEMCGNGARCFARFVRQLTGTDRDFTFETAAGVIGARFRGLRVEVTLTPPTDLQLDRAVTLASGPAKIHSLNTGVPQAVLFKEADRAMVASLGAEIRRHPDFGTRGTNVNFVQVLSPGSIRVRTFERGVEGETLACGTGVTAAALISARVEGFPSPVAVRVFGGDLLEVSWRDTGNGFADVCLTGPADVCFEGEIEV